MFREDMTLKAAEAIKMMPDEGAARMANRTYHMQAHTALCAHLDQVPHTVVLPGLSRLKSEGARLNR